MSGLLTFHEFSYRGTGWIPLIWMLIMAAVGFSLGYPGSRVIKIATVLCLILSPVVPIFFLQMFTLSTWDTAPQPRVAFEESDESKSPIFLFIFDGWSYQKSTADGEFHPHFENLHRVASKAFVFRQARSPGVSTKQSLPMILYQEDIPLEKREIFEPWLGRNSAAAGDLSSLFKRARSQNYSTALVGIYFPYPRIFGNEVDYIYSGAFEAVGQGLAGRVLSILAKNLRYLNDPISQHIDKRLIRRIISRSTFESNNRFLEETLWQLENSSSNTFAFFHLGIPHSPYVFNPDGTYYGHEGDDYRGPGDEAGYVRQLKFLDGVVGEIVATLERHGKFDKSMIIFTADHASKSERHSRDLRTHVPLIIKLPGQESAYVIEKPFQNNRLAPIIESVMRGHSGEGEILRVIRDAE